MILNGLAQKRIEIILLFLRLHPRQYRIFNSFVDYDGYSISSNGFLPTVVDIMDSREIKSVSPKGNQP